LRASYLLPVLIFAALAAALGFGLTLKPREIPSALIDKPVPDFALPPVQGLTAGLSSGDLRAGAPSLVNVFASWCGPCRTEHPLLMDIAKSGIVALHGLNYKDKPDAAASFLRSLGDPYRRTGADRDGRVAIEWGVYGVPETFLIDGKGRIVFKHVGPLTQDVLDKTILPKLAELKP
jgi:cytochrome c biogenesis protein CcmG/thiol:disulfide interchange protein DsbE